MHPTLKVQLKFLCGVQFHNVILMTSLSQKLTSLTNLSNLSKSLFRKFFCDNNLSLVEISSVASFLRSSVIVVIIIVRHLIDVFVRRRHLIDVFVGRWSVFVVDLTFVDDAVVVVAVIRSERRSIVFNMFAFGFIINSNFTCV